MKYKLQSLCLNFLYMILEMLKIPRFPFALQGALVADFNGINQSASRLIVGVSLDIAYKDLSKLNGITGGLELIIGQNPSFSNALQLSHLKSVLKNKINGVKIHKYISNPIFDGSIKGRGNSLAPHQIENCILYTFKDEDSGKNVVGLNAIVFDEVFGDTCKRVYHNLTPIETVLKGKYNSISTTFNASSPKELERSLKRLLAMGDDLNDLIFKHEVRWHSFDEDGENIREFVDKLTMHSYSLYSYNVFKFYKSKFKFIDAISPLFNDIAQSTELDLVVVDQSIDIGGVKAIASVLNKHANHIINIANILNGDRNRVKISPLFDLKLNLNEIYKLYKELNYKIPVMSQLDFVNIASENRWSGKEVRLDLVLIKYMKYKLC